MWELILQRYAGYQKQEISKRRAAFAERVRRIATDLLMAGKYPSRRRVLALMRDSEVRGEQWILREVRQAMRAFEGRGTSCPSKVEAGGDFCRSEVEVQSGSC